MDLDLGHFLSLEQLIPVKKAGINCSKLKMWFRSRSIFLKLIKLYTHGLLQASAIKAKRYCPVKASSASKMGVVFIALMYNSSKVFSSVTRLNRSTSV